MDTLDIHFIARHGHARLSHVSGLTEDRLCNALSIRSRGDTLHFCSLDYSESLAKQREVTFYHVELEWQVFVDNEKFLSILSVCRGELLWAFVSLQYLTLYGEIDIVGGSCGVTNYLNKDLLDWFSSFEQFVPKCWIALVPSSHEVFFHSLCFLRSSVNHLSPLLKCCGIYLWMKNKTPDLNRCGRSRGILGFYTMGFLELCWSCGPKRPWVSPQLRTKIILKRGNGSV